MIKRGYYAEQQRPGNLSYLCMDKMALRRWINGLFEKLSIQGVPVGAEALQAKMAQAGLTSNELSRGIVSARED